MADNKTTHTPSTTEPPALLESCPTCLTRNITPAWTEHPDPRTVQGNYLCPRCGEVWQCSWWTEVSDA